MTPVSNFLGLLLQSKESTEETFNFIFNLISKNYDKQKSYYNQYTTSSNGFLLNLCQCLLKVLFEKFNDENIKTNENPYGSNTQNINIFHYISQIDPEFGAVISPNLNLEKFERINSSIANDIIKGSSEKINSKKYNQITKLFFSIHFLLSYILKNLENDYTSVLKQLSEMFNAGNYHDPKTYLIFIFHKFTLIFRIETFAYYRAFDIYLKSPEFTKNLTSISILPL